MTDRNESEDEIQMLLPWYENGTLAPDEMRRVEDYLARHPEARAQFALIREEREETVAANERLGMPRSAARDRLMAVIAAEAGLVGQPSAAWWRRLLPEGWSPAWAMAAAAACLIIIVQAAALVSIGSGTHPAGNNRLAGEGQVAPSGTFVLISFAETAPARDIAELLQSVKGVIVDGPKPGGAYKVRISPRVLSNEERDAIIARLRAKTDVVAFIAPAG